MKMFSESFMTMDFIEEWVKKFKKIQTIPFVLIQIDISLHPGKFKTKCIV